MSFLVDYDLRYTEACEHMAMIIKTAFLKSTGLEIILYKI